MIVALDEAELTLLRNLFEFCSPQGVERTFTSWQTVRTAFDVFHRNSAGHKFACVLRKLYEDLQNYPIKNIQNERILFKKSPGLVSRLRQQFHCIWMGILGPYEKKLLL